MSDPSIEALQRACRFAGEEAKRHREKGRYMFEAKSLDLKLRARIALKIAYKLG